MINAAIFDLDGTLLDSMGAWETLGERYLQSLGKVCHDNLTQIFQAMTTAQSAQYCRNHYGLSLSVEEILAGMHAMIADDYGKTIPLKPGARDFLLQLKKHGVRLCAATSNDRTLSETALRRCGVLDLFSGLLTCAEIGHTKEEPVIYRNAMALLEASRDSTIVFEDSLYAAATAKQDGFRVAAVYDPFEKEACRLKSLADYYIDDYCNSDILTQLLQE